MEVEKRHINYIHIDSYVDHNHINYIHIYSYVDHVAENSKMSTIISHFVLIPIMYISYELTC